MRFDTTVPSLVLGLSFISQSVARPHTLAEAVAAPADSNTLDNAFAPELEKRAGTFAITGVPGNTYPRLELRQMLFSKPNQWSLFLQAMDQFQKMPQNDQMSYYGIAGIHGVPRQNWDGVGQCSNCNGAPGYCPHDMTIFPPWHRAYMALFEQKFMTIVNQIANSYPAGSSRNYMTGAASTMRFPFWDWAAHPQGNYPALPNVITDRYINVNSPSGWKQIENPLFRFHFTDSSQLLYSPFVNWPYTLRYPDGNNDRASSQESKATNAVGATRQSLQDQIYQLFTTCDDYLHFSNDNAGSSSTKCSNSLEGIHNTIHAVVGGTGEGSTVGGHMNYLPLAAFDPAFWLHHANVDRFFAMWQTLHTSYGSGANAPHSTWTIAQGTYLDGNSPLTPFHKDTNGNFHTGNGVKNWAQTFHYTYPEFADSRGGKNEIASYVNKLYGPSATATAGSSKRTAAPSPAVQADAHPTPAPSAGGLLEGLMDNISHLMETPFLAPNGSTFQYIANIHSPRYGLNGSYNVFLFDGEPACEDASTWFGDANLIGPMGVVSAPDMDHGNLMTSGSIPLTRTLNKDVDSGKLQDMSAYHVMPYLTKNLNWRIQGADGKAIDPASVDGFEVATFASTTSPLQSAFHLPVWSDFVSMAGVTCEKAGGAKWGSKLFGLL